MHINKTRKIDTEKNADAFLQEAAQVIERGGVIVLPTSYLYGLSADIFNPGAVKRVFEIKRRPIDKALSILVKTLPDVNRYVRHIPHAAEKIMNRFWPGKITIVFFARDDFPDILTAGTGKIGIRVPAHPVAARLLELTKNPITGTSANISNDPGISRIADLNAYIAQEVDLILDGGSLKGGLGSTVVDITQDPPHILREGAVSSAEILDVLNR